MNPGPTIPNGRQSGAKVGAIPTGIVEPAGGNPHEPSSAVATSVQNTILRPFCSPPLECRMKGVAMDDPDAGIPGYNEPLDSEWIDPDPDFRETLRLLNAASVHTVSSCQGHPPG